VALSLLNSVYLRTRLYSLDGGMQKPDSASTLLHSVYLMLKTETLIETLMEEVKWYSECFLLYCGRYRAFSPEPGSHFYRKDIIFPMLSLSRAECLCLSLFVSVCNPFVNFKCTCIQKHKKYTHWPIQTSGSSSQWFNLSAAHTYVYWYEHACIDWCYFQYFVHRKK